VRGAFVHDPTTRDWRLNTVYGAGQRHLEPTEAAAMSRVTRLRGRGQTEFFSMGGGTGDKPACSAPTSEGLQLGHGRGAALVPAPRVTHQRLVRPVRGCVVRCALRV